MTEATLRSIAAQAGRLLTDNDVQVTTGPVVKTDTKGGYVDVALRDGEDVGKAEAVLQRRYRNTRFRVHHE